MYPIHLTMLCHGDCNSMISKWITCSSFWYTGPDMRKGGVSHEGKLIQKRFARCKVLIDTNMWLSLFLCILLGFLLITPCSRTWRCTIFVTKSLLICLKGGALPLRPLGSGHDIQMHPNYCCIPTFFIFKPSSRNKSVTPTLRAIHLKRSGAMFNWPLS